jgi:Zn finger protein HypA/HybF involved in hydrogenase expression
MHDGCSGTFVNGTMVVDKVRQMGFNYQFLPVPFEINCSHCGQTFLMDRFETHCPNCDMVYAVTPCHSFDPANIMPAGIGY